MTNNYQNRNQGQGGQGPRQNNNRQPAQPKTEIQARYSVTTGGNSTYNLVIKVRGFLSGQPIANQEVVLELGVNPVASDILDINGDATFQYGGSLLDTPQTLDFHIFLSGTMYERALTVTIPAKTPPTKKDLQVRIISQNVNSATNTYHFSFEVTALEEGKPFIGQDVSMIAGALPRQTVRSDNRGMSPFLLDVPQTKTEQTVVCSFSLDQFGYEEKITGIIPAIEKKKEPDAEHLILMVHNAGAGNFQVKTRILGEKGIGMANKAFAIFFNGRNYTRRTNQQGEYLFDVPAIIPEGGEEKLIATVSGIEQEAHVHLKRRRCINKPAPFTRPWYLGVNNGRAFLLVCLTVFVWFFAILIGPGKALINPSVFRTKQDGVYLSAVEREYNKTMLRMKDNSFLIKTEKPSSGHHVIWKIAILLTLISLVYAPLSAREEIAEAYEETIEKLFSREYAKAGDPAFERLARLVGTYSVIRKKQRGPTVLSGADITDQSNQDGSSHNKLNETVDIKGHPSLATLFSLDLMSDALVAIVPAIPGIFRKVFRS